MLKRRAKIHRKTKETNVLVEVNIDGKGESVIDTGIGFLNHMLELFAKHSLIDVKVKAKGDLWIDDHHTIEDVAITLGLALRKALGKRVGIYRYGFLLPMDETLAEVAIDLSGRPYLVWNASFRREKIGDFPTELFEHFFRSLTDNLQANIHVNIRYGKNEHHKAEAIFKAFAKALRFAVSYDERAKEMIPSTKGVL